MIPKTACKLYLSPTKYASHTLYVCSSGIFAYLQLKIGQYFNIDKLARYCYGYSNSSFHHSTLFKCFSGLFTTALLEYFNIFSGMFNNVCKEDTIQTIY